MKMNPMESTPAPREGDPPPHVETRQLSLRYAHTTSAALEDLSLTIASGEWLTVAGRSGAGKTTLLRLLAGLERPTHGVIQFNGRNQLEVPPHCRGVGYLFQEPALFPDRDVRANLAFGAGDDETWCFWRSGRRDLKARRAARIEAVALQLGIADLLDRAVETLSGGQRQRVALGRALVHPRPLLLLDEPLAALDPDCRRDLIDDLRDLRPVLRATVVHVTHDLRDALALADRVAVLGQGRLRQIGPPAALRNDPDHLDVIGLFDDPPVNRLAGRLATDGGKPFSFLVDSLGCAIRLPKVESSRLRVGPAILAIRPEAISWEDPPRLDEPRLDLIDAADETTRLAVEDRGWGWIVTAGRSDRRFRLRALRTNPPGLTARQPCQAQAVANLARGRWWVAWSCCQWFDPATGCRLDRAVTIT